MSTERTTIVATAIDGTRLAAHKTGSGPAVFALHGGPGNDHRGFGAYLDPIAAYSSLYLLDARGCGDSEDAPLASYTVPRLAEDIDDTLRSLGEDQVDLIAHSFGGLAALTYALSKPERVRTLILVSSPIRGWRGVLSAPGSWPLWARTFMLGLRKDSDFVEFHLQHEVANAARRDDVRAVLRQPIRFDPHRFKALGSAGIRPIDAAPSIAAGVRLAGIYGKQDRRFLGDAAYLRRLGVDVALLNQCGHFPFIEQHREFHRVTRQLLEAGRSCPRSAP